ncbi:hypothetical protein [Streptomyces sp. WY228]|uniref:hypothetical protein n=1 Tax=Streptomyces sp. WY228 TaxID=2855836 RepID=UPI001C4F4EEF|nr:hypothetical protein [Streptomyces sp. WY228]QXR01248.1 hypothetical protein KV381_36245 [Streptomyces sp. WY228]
MSETVYRWLLRVVPLGSAAPGRGRSSFASEEDRGRALVDLEDVPVLALFGERGAGKSVTILREGRAVGKKKARPHRIDLGRHQTESQIGAALAAARRPDQAGRGWLFLDSEEEGLNVLPSLGGVIANWIGSLSEEQRLGRRLWFTCRTGVGPKLAGLRRAARGPPTSRPPQSEPLAVASRAWCGQSVGYCGLVDAAKIGLLGAVAAALIAALAATIGPLTVQRRKERADSRQRLGDAVARRIDVVNDAGVRCRAWLTFLVRVLEDAQAGRVLPVDDFDEKREPFRSAAERPRSSGTRRL